MYPRIKLAVPLYRPAGIGSTSVDPAIPLGLLSKLRAWNELQDVYTDSWGAWPLVDTSSGAGSFANASTYGSGLAGRCLTGSLARTRTNIPNYGTGKSFFLGAFRSTSAFTADEITAFMGRATFNDSLSLSESGSGFRSRGVLDSAGPGVYAADVVASANTWTLTIAQHSAAGTVRNHQDTTLNAATNVGNVNLNPTSFVSLGNVARTTAQGSEVARLFWGEGEITQDELTYLHNNGAGRTISGIIADAGYVQPTMRFGYAGDTMAESYSGKMISHSDADAASQKAKAVTAVSSGKRWFAFKNFRTLDAIQSTFCGLVSTDESSYTLARIGFSTPGTQIVAGAFTIGTNPTITGASEDDYIMCAVDFTARKVWFGKNGTWSGDPVAGTGHAASFSSAQDLHIYISSGSALLAGQLLCLTGEMPYSNPTGYTPWGD